MLGIVLAAAIHGFIKGAAFQMAAPGLMDSPIGVFGHLSGVAAEELAHRVAVEGLGHALGLGEWPTRLVGSALFGLGHATAVPCGASTWFTTWRVADAALGGLVYSIAFKRGGLVGAIGTHLAHNLAIGLARKAV